MRLHETVGRESMGQAWGKFGRFGRVSARALAYGLGFSALVLGGPVAIALLFIGTAQAAHAFPSEADVKTHLRDNLPQLGALMQDYNLRRQIFDVGGWVADRAKVGIRSWRLDSLELDHVFVEVAYRATYNGEQRATGTVLLELTWHGTEIAIVNHWNIGAAKQKTAPAAVAYSGPARTLDEATAYFEDNLKRFAKDLEAYNRKVRIETQMNAQWNVKVTKWKIDEVVDDRVYVDINFEVGAGSWSPQPGSARFGLRWDGDRLAIVSHGEMKKRLNGPIVLEARDDHGCVYNYYAARPCIDTVSRWREFTGLHDLPLDEESAAIFQAYRQHEKGTGDRLMARALGLPEPSGSSVFGLQAEITALDLTQYQRNAKVPCDLNPYDPHPCLEILEVFQEFAARHGLPADRRSAAMLEAYAEQDYRRADVVYALAKGLPVPAYGYVPTGIAGEVAARWRELDNMQNGRKIACGYNPHGARPCPEVIPLWREFADRYGLDDDAANASIFEAYAEGNYRRADQMFAQVKGVSLEQLLEASGVPTQGLVIEVYPGGHSAPARTGS